MYDARLANNVSACTQTFTKDACLSLVGGTKNEFQANNKTAPRIENQIKELIAAWEWQELNNQRIVIDGNNIAVMYELTAIFNPTGEQITTAISDHLVINDDGKIKELIEFVDTAMIDRLSQSVVHQSRIDKI